MLSQIYSAFVVLHYDTSGKTQRQLLMVRIYNKKNRTWAVRFFLVIGITDYGVDQ